MSDRPETMSAGGQPVFRLVERLPGGGQLVEDFHAPDRGQAVRRVRSIPVEGEIELWDGPALVWRSDAGRAVKNLRGGPARPPEPRSFRRRT